MRYFWDSITTQAYWRFAVLSKQGVESIFAWFGGIYLFVEALDFFGAYTRDKYAPYAVVLVAILSVGLSILMRRPTAVVQYKLPNRDCLIEVRVADLFDQPGAIVISTNTTFDTDVAGGVIAADSLQGQFFAKYFIGRASELDAEIEAQLEGKDYLERPTKQKGKLRSFPMGTTVTINTHGKTFYLCAMANLSDEGTAGTTMTDLDEALDGLWEHISRTGELQEISLPVIGTGRGRLKVNRTKVIEQIAQSFVDASSNKVFAQKLGILVRAEDAKRFDVNLWEVRDHLGRALSF